MTDEQTIEHIRLRCTCEEGGCWIWNQVAHQGKYPVISIGTKQHMVRRLVWKITRGSVSHREPVLARCEDDLCVNPAHLRKTTFSALRKGRKSSLARNLRIAEGKRAVSKINWNVVRTIRASDATNTALAQEFGVSRETVARIRRHDSWKETTNPFAALIGGRHA
jgi:hypothetical protein